MTDFSTLLDLASERVGGTVLAANDEFFAPKENLLREAAPVFKPDLYTERGKWMDGWETRRRREPGHDWCIVRLGVPGIVRGVVVDTTHFRGNHPEACSVEGCALDGHPDLETLEAADWTELLARRELVGHGANPFAADKELRLTHLRLRIYPDGGVARLRVFGDPVPRWGRLAARGLVDVALASHGGQVVAVSDEFFASQHHLILPGPAKHMGDGWETRRRRGAGHDWVIVRLGARAVVRALEVDTGHYKGNAPDSAWVEGCVSPARLPPEGTQWRTILPRMPLRPDTVHELADELEEAGEVTHVRLSIYPDGGVARLRVLGQVSDAEVLHQGVRWLDALPDGELNQKLLACCGSRGWAAQMRDHRPFGEPSRLFENADRLWRGLGRDDWLEAFSAHPRIGERKPASPSGDVTSRWSAQEQSTAAVTDPGVEAELARAQRAYEERFGHIFLVCATGKRRSEILSALRERLDHDPDEELAVAAEEQRRITRLRLEKLLRS